MFCRVRRGFRASYTRIIRRLACSAAERSGDYKLVDVDEVTQFAQRCLVAAGALQPHAATLASVLVYADVRGHFSHGLNRLGKVSLASTNETT